MRLTDTGSHHRRSTGARRSWVWAAAAVLVFATACNTSPTDPSEPEPPDFPEDVGEPKG
jgi:hypothetical protein